MSENTVTSKVISIRISKMEADELDALREAMRGLGLELSRHAAAQAALRRGLADLARQASHLPVVGINP